MKKQRKMKKSKQRRQKTTTYDPNSKSRYSQKKALQAKGIYSPNSPFKVTYKEVEEETEATV